MALNSREQQKADRAAGRDPWGGGSKSDSGGGGGSPPTGRAVGVPPSTPTLSPEEIAKYRGYLRNITTNPNQDYLDELVRTEGKPGSYINPEAPYDYGTPQGLGKLGLELVSGKVGGLKALGKSIKYNYERQKALRDSVAADYGVSQAEAQNIMDKNKLNITDTFGGMAGFDFDDGSGGGIGMGYDSGGRSPFTQMMGTPAGGAGGAYTSAAGAAGTAASYQEAAMKYLMEQDAAQSAMRTGAQQRIGGALGIPGGVGTQQEMIEQAMASPLYGEIMGGREAGEEAILRSAGATGGLRSGNVQEALYDYNAGLERKALLDSYNQQMSGLQGLSGLGSHAPQIASGMAGIGETLSSGQVAQQQMEEAKKQQMYNNIFGGLKLGTDLYSSGALSGIGSAVGNIASTIGGWFSDRRLKKNIQKIGEANGLNLYRWDWNIVANKMGMVGESFGCMADEVYKKHPDCVIMRDMFMFVLYPKIGINHG